MKLNEKKINYIIIEKNKRRSSTEMTVEMKIYKFIRYIEEIISGQNNI
jgi:hypothetical protein